MKRFLILAAAALACGPDFTDPEEIDRLRILGVRTALVEDPTIAWPGVDQDLRLSALVTNEAGGQPEVSWRFCPLAFGSAGGLECVFDEESFAQVLEQAIRAAAAEDPNIPDIPDDQELPITLDFDIQTESSSTAIFNLTTQLLGEEGEQALRDFGIDPAPAVESVVAGFCEQIQFQEFPEFVERPACDGTFDFRFDLVVASGEQRVTAVRPFTVIYDATSPFAAPNTNPRARLLCASNPEGISDYVQGIAPSDRDDIDIELELGTACRAVDRTTTISNGAFPVSDDGARVFLNAGYQLAVADLCLEPGSGQEDPDCAVNAEAFEVEQEVEDGVTEVVTERERLSLSWFVDAGELDRSRTAFEAGNDISTLERAATNTWELPRAVDFEDDPGRPMELFVVIRDGRGGQTFIEASLPLGSR